MLNRGERCSDGRMGHQGHEGRLCKGYSADEMVTGGDRRCDGSDSGMHVVAWYSTLGYSGVLYLDREVLGSHSGIFVFDRALKALVWVLLGGMWDISGAEITRAEEDSQILSQVMRIDVMNKVHRSILGWAASAEGRDHLAWSSKLHRTHRQSADDLLAVGFAAALQRRHHTPSGGFRQPRPATSPKGSLVPHATSLSTG